MGPEAAIGVSADGPDAGTQNGHVSTGGLMRAIVRDAPGLTCGLCVGRAPDWDADDDSIAEVTDTCQRCPVLQACSDWLWCVHPLHRPSGVVAAEVIRHPEPWSKAS